MAVFLSVLSMLAAQCDPRQGSQCTPSQLELKLKKARIQNKEQNKELDSENSALKVTDGHQGAVLEAEQR